MDVMEIIALVIGCGVLGLLIWAMLRPEKF
jgi:hypothetical protein